MTEFSVLDELSL